MNNMVGKIIQNYMVTDFIDEGGMGSVYRGINIKLNRPVAIKILHTNLTSNHQFRERFLNEAKILAKLSNLNIINIYDFIELENQFFIIMEFIDGNTLDKLIISQNLNSIDVILKIFLQVLSGMQYAHNQGIVHRDIKPSNIIIQSDFLVKILDFGIAKLNDSNQNLTKTGTKLGSIYYMSPEQVLGQNVDHRSDIYSLGIILFEMLTKRLPYNNNSQSDYELMDLIINQEIPDVKQLNNSYNSNISSCILKACSKNPINRFQSCDEFMQALNDVSYNYNNSYIEYTNKINKTDANTNNKNRTQIEIPYQSENKGNKSTIIIISIIITIIIGLVALFYFLNQNKTTSFVNSSILTDTMKNSSESKNEFNLSETNSENNNLDLILPVKTVKGFITDLGNQNFRNAYDKQRNKSWGTFENFSSIKSFGGINSTIINDIKLNYEYSSDASVIIDYYSYDSYNKNGQYVQEFILRKFGNDWKIVKVRNINIKQW